jgi:putative hydrolase of the HAD superfamily
MSDNVQLLWVTDADNTLWNTNGVYARAQLGLVDELTLALQISLRDSDPLAWLRAVDQDIASAHPQGLRYPPELLVSALATKLKEQQVGASAVTSPEVALPRAAVREIVENYLESLKAVPEIARGVREGLQGLSANKARVIVVTEGARRRIEETLLNLSLMPFVETVIEERKSVDLFARLRDRHEGMRAWAVGDQLDRDVLPAVEAGLHGVFIEGGFQPHWHPLVAENAGYIICDDYAQAVSTALEHCSP